MEIFKQLAQTTVHLILRAKDLGIDDFSKIPNGAPGVEHRLALLYTYGVLENRISVNKFVEVTSTNAAKIFGMYPKKVR